MLKQRTITAAILLISVGILLIYASPLIFALASWLICLMAIYELTTMYQFNFWPKATLMLIATLIILSISHLNYDISQIMRILSVAMWCFVVPLVLIFVPKYFSKTTIAIFSLLLFVPSYYALTVLHSLFGALQLLSIMAIAWVADTGAYFVGKCYGKHKLAPKISPGKSIEGALGGLVLVIIYLTLLKVFNLVDYLPRYSLVLKFALILTTISIIGDLFESWLKRVANVKDSGKLLPGHGGVYDRIDSLIAVLVITFALIRGML